MPFSVHSVVCGVFCLTPLSASRVGVLLFVIPKTRRSLLISVAIWGRDIRIVMLTGLFWLINLGGAIYGKFFLNLSLSHSAVEVLIQLFTALTRVGFSFGPIYLDANTTSCLGSRRMVSGPEGLCHQRHKGVHVKHYDQFR